MSETRALIPDLSPLGRQRWKPFVEDEDLACYSFYLPHPRRVVSVASTDTRADADAHADAEAGGAFTPSQLDSWFRKLHPSNYADEPTGSAWTNATYKNQLLLRKTAWHTFDDECTCEYGYSDTWQQLVKSRKMMEVLKEITTVVSNVVGLGDGELNAVNANYYPQGGGVGYHADDEFLFDGLNRECCIVSLSLCSATHTGDTESDVNFGARKFQVKRKGKKYQSDVSEIILRHGDLMTMEGMFQRHYLHSVWPGDSKKQTDHEICQGERINLTWRTIVRHLDGSPECNGLVCPLSKPGELRLLIGSETMMHTNVSNRYGNSTGSSVHGST